MWLYLYFMCGFGFQWIKNYSAPCLLFIATTLPYTSGGKGILGKIVQFSLWAVC